MSRSSTAASSLSTAATLFAGPGRASNSTPSVNGSASFRFVIDGDIQTLSAKNAPEKGAIKGLLFVPSLSSQDPCNNMTAPFIPENVTRHEDVSPFGYRTIGLAPWISPNCSHSFLDAAGSVGPEALVFFLPTSDDIKPPPPTGPTWFLDGGISWESESTYPVYAIPGPAGITLMEQLSWYSGNAAPSSAQNGTAGLSQRKPWDMRLFTLIDLEKSGGKATSLWGFLLAILGTILVICIILLVVFQVFQRRRRQSRQRRLEVGESTSLTTSLQYDLQHFRVPPELLMKLPVFIYPSLDDSGTDSSPENKHSNDRPDAPDGTQKDEKEQSLSEKQLDPEPEEQTKDGISLKGENTLAAEQVHNTTNTNFEDILAHRALPKPYSPITASDPPYLKHANRLSHSQTTCAICLDDFVPASSTIRELPCGHIYHPECIDVSLTQSSSLCPLCKKCVLEPDFFISAPEAVFQRYSMGQPQSLEA